MTTVFLQEQTLKMLWHQQKYHWMPPVPLVPAVDPFAWPYQQEDPEVNQKKNKKIMAKMCHKQKNTMCQQGETGTREREREGGREREREREREGEGDRGVGER